MNNDLQLTISHGIQHTTRDVVFPESMTQAMWLEYGRFLKNARQSTTFWEARWMQYGRRHYGDEFVRESLAQLEFEFQDLRKAELLNKIELRDPQLSAEHHFVLAKSKLDETGRQMWVQLAKEKDLTAPELQESIRLGQVTKAKRAEDGEQTSAGVASVQGIARQWDLLMRQIGDLWKEWDIREIDQFLGEIRPILDFAAELNLMRRGFNG